MKIDIFADILPKNFRIEGTYYYEIDTVRSSYEIRFTQGSFVVVKNNEILQLLNKSKMAIDQLLEYEILLDDYWINLQK